MPVIIYIIAWFLLPLIPAFLLFKFLPSTGNIEGPFKGMAIKFGGAFAGYFLLFLISYTPMRTWIKKADEPREVWTIVGNISSSDTRFRPEQEQPAFVINPLRQRFQRSDFDVEVVADFDGKDFLNFPMLALTALSYKQEPLPHLYFNKSKGIRDTSNYVMVDKESRIIRLKKPVFLEPIAETPVNIEEISVDTTISNF